MPPQHVEIAETIAALKRTLRREKEAPTNQPTSAATNRGHKLARGASYIHAGALPYPHGPEGQKQKIEHAGYTRYILCRNPRRYNEYGDELAESESDAEADADAYEENPYAGVRIEELLRPLRHPSELANHPTLSLPFVDGALPDMVRSTEEKLRQERANLWRAKNLSRQFMGDEPWMPCGSVEAGDDWDLFEPKPKLPAPQAGRKRKRDLENEAAQNGVLSDPFGKADRNGSAPNLADEADSKLPEQFKQQGLDNDADEEHLEVPTKERKSTTTVQAPATNGFHQNGDGLSSAGVMSQSQKNENGDGKPSLDLDGVEGHDQEAVPEDDEAPRPTRRITRALAAEHNTSTAVSPPLSPNSTASSFDSSLLQLDPLFLLPPSLAADHRAPRNLARLGLPVEELIETRRLLMLYIQKQEESVRGYEAVLGKLVKAKRMRDKVWELCKTEGHVGEWSDGEDWIDAEAWGLLPEELKKGKDEEEVDGAQEDTGRKGKRRRRD